MKKSLIFVGLLAIGYANAQEYDGKVGINTNEPKATLDITPEANNLTGTTNEGIIAPRLSKTRIANIEASKLTEGTLVYATDAVYTAGADTAKNGRVAKINEKGYYFYNGTEWVKVQYKDNNDAEWVYDDTTKRINLKRSGVGDFNNKIFYDVQTGGYFNYDNPELIGVIGNWGIGENSNISNIDIKEEKEKIPFLNVNQQTASRIRIDKTASTLAFGGKTLDILNIDNQATINQAQYVKNISNATFISQTAPDFTSRMSLLNALHGRTLIKSGTVHDALGAQGEVFISGGKMTGYAVGLNALMSVNNYNSPSSVMAGRLRTSIGEVENASFANLWGVLAEHYFGSKNININNVSLFKGYVSFSNANTAITNYYGIELRANNINKNFSNVAIQHNYGIYVDDVVNAKQSNYAVYTKAGQVRIGDLAQSGATSDRVVTVDADGVLKTGGSIAANNGVQTQTTMECNEDNRGKMNFGRISINSKETDAIGFCMKNGDNQFRWYYIYGGASHTVGTNANFGQGL